MVKGTAIDFEYLTPYKNGRDSVYSVKPDEIMPIDKEISKLLQQKVIKKTDYEIGEFVSHIFTRKKQNSQIRLILSLKELNQTCSYRKFKMTGFQSALDLITKECWMASVDLVSAYYSVPIAKQHQKYLKFIWKGQRYAFKCYPNGLSQAPRNFTKLTKPIFASLHNLGHIVTGYLDDTLIIGRTIEECQDAISETIDHFQKLGFTIHPDKSVLRPTQKIQYLGFQIDSINMVSTLPPEKKSRIKELCEDTILKKKHTIRQMATVIGTLVSSFPGVEYGPLYYRHLEDNKKRELVFNKGDWECDMSLDAAALNELRWWSDQVMTSQKVIHRGQPDLVITSDSSGFAYGVVCEKTSINGLWSFEEKKVCHINELEMLASFFGLQVFAKNMTHKYIELRMDNVPALTCLNKMGSHKLNKLNTLTQKIWHWCIARQIHIISTYIPGKDNIDADEASRKLHIDTEWMLNPSLLLDALEILKCRPSIDLFASRINKQFHRYISYQPEPESISVNAFNARWNNEIIYCFPPFNLVTKVLCKIMMDKATGIVVAPFWPAQPFYPMLANMLTQKPILLSSRQTLLQLPTHPENPHPLNRSLKLLVCAVSGKTTQSEAFLMTQPTSSWRHGVQKRRNRMNMSSKNGNGMHVKGRWIRFLHL